MSETIRKIEDILEKSSNSTKNTKGEAEKKKKPNAIIPRGIPKSGRTWKTPKTRFSSVIKTRGIQKANKFEKLQALKRNLNRVKELTRGIEEKFKEKIEKKKERRRKNIQREKENRLKSEIVQVITNSAKIKRMKKKQLRAIEKRDTLKK